MTVLPTFHLSRPALSPRRLVLGGAALAVALLALQAIVAPARADAVLGLPSPGEIVKDGVESAFDFVIKQLFGGIPSKLTEAAVSWQLHLPSEAFTNSNVAELNRTTTAAAFALLGLVMTAGVLRYWLTGFLEGAGGVEGVSGFARGIAAALGVIAWPWVFDSAITLVNSLTFELIQARSVHDDVSRMLGAAVGISLTSGPVGMLASVVIVIAGTLLMLGLFALHIVLACGLLVIFVAGPLLIVLAPFPGTAWMSVLAFRAFTTLLAWPVIWAVCFASFAAVFNDFVTFRGDGGVLDKALIKPLTGVAMLYLCVKLPLLATKASMVGLAGAGTVGFAARYFAVRQAGAALGGTSAAGGSATPRHRGGATAAGSARPTDVAPRSGVDRGEAPATAAVAAHAGSTAAQAAAAGRSSSHDTSTAGPASPRGDQRSTSRATSESPAGMRVLGDRPRELEEAMHRARRRAGAPGQPAPATDGDVATSLRQLGPERAGQLGNVYDRAIASGRNREEAMAAVTSASAIGAARAEHAGRPAAARSFSTIGSAPTHAFSAGLEAYRAELPQERAGQQGPVALPGRPPAEPDRPATRADRPTAPSRPPGGVS
ncbi:hypothetical protein VSS74_01305 [Conexibacter stalactiti]|uniref:TrbL/VirB6 plasmid conjugal transfer protein n=1 Tax=Conexibacter stalactiti TaxID=1940611 RepID=A0ABU4HLP2_9ACTN|nr:hypothetical protein [Conexibacter stalactiti]MDW5592954.1 hypothetical protein [Conexibacter stalactiti]MEC5033595.1 hypothetical protein [Conexibacter stalactiti]